MYMYTWYMYIYIYMYKHITFWYINMHIYMYICTYLAAEFVGSRRYATAVSLQVLNSCTDLDPTLLYILILRTHTKFARENKTLALGVCFPHHCSSDGRRFANHDDIWITIKKLVRFHKNEIDEILCKLDSSEFACSFEQNSTLP